MRPCSPGSTALLYFPTHDVVYPLTAFGPGAEDVRFGEQGRLHGVFVPAPNPAPVDPAAHAGLLPRQRRQPQSPRAAYRPSRLRAWRHVFIFDYQGYGQSGGRPSELATAADARAAIAYLRGRSDVDPKRIAYYGESLGGAVALDLATEVPPAGLAIQSSFTSIADMTRLHYRPSAS